MIEPTTINENNQKYLIPVFHCVCLDQLIFGPNSVNNGDNTWTPFKGNLAQSGPGVSIHFHYCPEINQSPENYV